MRRGKELWTEECEASANIPPFSTILSKSFLFWGATVSLSIKCAGSVRVNLEMSSKFSVLCYVSLIVSVELQTDNEPPSITKIEEKPLEQFSIKIVV